MTASNIDDVLQVDSSVQAFLDHLGLPLVHPLNYTTDEDSQVFTSHDELSFVGEGVFELPPIAAASFASGNNNKYHLRSNNNELLPTPFIGPMSQMELHDHSLYELFLTLTKIGAPLIAMGELWLRLFAFYMCPVCLVWLVYHRERKSNNNKDMFFSILGLASSAVLFTDSLYVYEFGRLFGFSFWCMAIVLAIRLALLSIQANPPNSVVTSTKSKSSGIGSIRMPDKNILFQSAIFICIFTTVVVFLQSDGHVGNAHSNTILRQMPHPGIDLPTIEPGLYYCKSNPLITAVASNLKESAYTYDVQHGATPYLVSGDQRTGIPFLVNSVEEQQYIRVYVSNPFDGEHLALDIAFPFDAFNYGIGKRKLIHDSMKPVYLVLHGLNGGSHEEYVKDLVKRRRAEGSTVVVLIARGMMDTKMSGWNVFHGARTGDVDIAARALRRGLTLLAETQRRPRRQVLIGVGYSMGAIILSNYVARSGKHCSLDAAIAVSGGLDMRQNLNFRRSMRLWQPMLTFGLRDDILIGKYARFYKHKLTRDQFLSMLRTTSVSALDVEAIVTYNSFNNLVHYYSEMSAMGDRVAEFGLLKANSNSSECVADEWGRISNTSIPFAVLQALDDPLVGWRTIGTERPQELVDSGNGNVMLLLTKAGGHVGWPLGLNPKANSWKWMSDSVRDFALAVDESMK
jgi:predicted alpha/beta-fold hydrolase